MTVREGSRDSRLPFYRTVRSVGERAGEHGNMGKCGTGGRVDGAGRAGWMM